MWAEQSYFAMFFATALCGVWAASTGLKTCDHYYYYDHGTEDCEPCGDICDEANHTNTVPQCWELCRDYALILWPPDPPKSPTTDPRDRGDDKNSDNMFSSGADAVIIVLSVFCIGGLLCTVFLKRKAIASKFRRPAAPPAQTAEVQVPLQAPNPDPQDVSMVPMPGSAESGALAGIQEQQGAECPAESNSWRILPQAPSTPSKRNAQHPGVKSPVQVSMEGNSEAIHFALPGRRIPSSPVGPGPADTLSDDREDLDSTELKTLLPSLDDSFATEGCGGMVTSRV